MAPTFQTGERLTALRRWRRVRAGDVVVVRDRSLATGWMIKRCVAREGSLLDLRGDNVAESTDSRDFGLVPSSAAKYIVIVTSQGAGDPQQSSK